MKRCLTCQRTYTDDTLRFCLQDGAVLVTETQGSAVPDPEATLVSEARQGSRNEGPPTEVLSPRGAQTIAVQNPSQTAPPQSYPSEIQGRRDTTPTAKPRNTVMIVVVSVIGTILLLSLGAVGFFAYLKNRGDAERARIVNAEDNRAANNANTQANNTTNNINRASANANVNANANANTRPSPTPALSPTPAPVDSVAVASQVTSTLNGWAAATTARNLNAHMNYYADTLDTYYNAKAISSAKVRTDRERAFNAYSSMDVQLSNIRVTPDATGQRATVTFDKTWTFEGDKYSNGSVQQLVTLEKQGGRWRITGEKDLRIYYVNH
jgi:ketosteroid isomerase-like protein